MNGFVSLKQVMDNVLDHPLMQNLSFERAVNYAVRFIRLMGMPKQFIEKTAIIPIKEYRGCLPCDYYEMIQVRLADGKHGKGHRPYMPPVPVRDPYFRYTTDNFHMSKDKQPSWDLTYKIQGTIIYTSVRDCEIEISYRAIPVDDEGYPMIPDDSAFIHALEMYLKKEHFTVLFDVAAIQPQVLANAQQEYSWAVGQAQSSMAKLSIDEMEAFTNMLNTMVTRVTEHEKGFINEGSREHIRLK